MSIPSTKLFLVFAFFTFLVLPLILSVRNVRAQNPQQVFHPEIKELIDEDNTLYQQAQQNNQVYVAGSQAGDYAFRSDIFSLIKAIDCPPTLISCDRNSTAMGVVAGLIGTVYDNPVASGIGYTRHVLTNAGILAKPAYAQGIGFAGLSPILPFWTASRNIAYATMIIVMVFIGFMIIFRMKIDPKTVISIQAALPKIVITLILITFSYPIVGFMVDLMYLVMAIAIAIMAQGIGGSFGVSTTDLQTVYLNAGGFDLLGIVFSKGFASGVGLFWQFVAGGTVGTTFFARLLTQPWLLAIPSLIFVVILVMGLLFSFIRILLLLINSYIQLLLGLILGPVLLLGEAIPGRSAFKDWIFNIMANLVVFPATAIILIFSSFMSAQGQLANTALWSPPFTGLPGFGLFQSLVGLAVIFLAPQLIAQVKKMFHPKPALPVTAGTAFAPLTQAVGTGTGAATQFYYMHGIYDFFARRGQQQRRE